MQGPCPSGPDHLSLVSVYEASHRSWMSLSCTVCCSWTVARSFLRCSHCCVTWLSFISCSSLLWLLLSSDHSLVCCAVMVFTYTDHMHTAVSNPQINNNNNAWKHDGLGKGQEASDLGFMISDECLDLIFCLLLQLLAVVVPVRKEQKYKWKSKPCKLNLLS